MITENFPNDATPDEVQEVTERLQFTDEPARLPVRVGQDTAPDLVPRSVKISTDLDRACKKRALSLGLSQSAYIRRLIERDLAAAGTGEARPAWVLELLGVIAHYEHEYPKVS